MKRIKEKVKKTMMGRTAEQMGGSLKKYASQEYDFSIMPQNGKQISDEHIQKIVDPLLEINDFLPDNSLKKERKETKK